MRICVFLIMALLVAAVPAVAQNSDEDVGSEANESLITFVVQAQLPTTPQALPISSPILERIGDEPSLARLDMEGGGDTARMVAHFVFLDRAAFDRWYTSEETRDLLRELAGRGADEALFAFTLNRYPYAQMFER